LPLRAGSARVTRLLNAFAAVKTSILMPVLSGLVLLAQEGLAASSEGGGTPPSGAPQEVVLDYREVNYSLANNGWAVTQESSPFKKEPLVEKRSVFRGLLNWGDRTADAVPFLWDYSKGKLYLDLNRNRDLTDDPEGVLTSPRTGSYQLFTNVHLTCKTPSGSRRCLFDLNLSRQGEWASAYVNLRSLWAGKMTLQGQDREIGLVENPPGRYTRQQQGFLVLRPWADRESRIELADGTPEAIRFPKRLYWQNQAFEVARQFETQGNEEKCRLKLTPQQPRLGELKVSGACLHRIILEDPQGYTAVLDSPAGSTKIPPGNYNLNEVWVKSGTNLAVQTAERKIVIKEGAPASLLTGGPLTNSVTAGRRGQHLVLSYQLVGADKGTYRLTEHNRSKPPEFAIYQGGKKVASGQFAFG
jgi:hypothetical protein